MTANHVTPFEAFKSFVEFYPKLGATIAFGTMAAAARMIPTSGAAISDTPQIAKGPVLVSPANISSPRKRSTTHKKTAQNLQASDRPPEGRLIQRRAYWSGRPLLICYEVRTKTANSARFAAPAVAGACVRNPRELRLAR